MGGLGFLLGGALEGYGKGVAAQATLDAEERRQQALENLRSRNSMGETTHRAREEDWVNSRQTERTTNAQITTDTHRGKIDEGKDTRRFAQEERMTKLTSDLRIMGDAASARLADQLERGRRSGEIHDVVQNTEGDYFIIDKAGKSRPLAAEGGAPLRGALPKSQQSGDDSVITRVRGGQTSGTTPAPAASPAKPVRARTAAPKTYTMADAQATAKQHGKSLDEVHRRMRAAGYKLTKE